MDHINTTHKTTEKLKGKDAGSNIQWQMALSKSEMICQHLYAGMILVSEGRPLMEGPVPFTYSAEAFVSGL